MPLTPLPDPAWDWLNALREPGVVTGWSLADWQRVIRLSRRLRLLGRLAERVSETVGLDPLPVPVARNLLSEMRYARVQTRALCWAAERAGAALDGADYPRVLLKGAAYIAQGLSIGRGRQPSDIDLLVPHAALDDARQRLSTAGWKEVALDAHDQRYYREWSHETPPMRHPGHALELDLHHNILPPVARMTVDAALLLGRARPSPWPGWQVLDPMDQILHSAAHLFQDSDLTDRVRDLVDLDALLRQQGEDPSLWDALIARARQLGLVMPLALACHFCALWFRTPVPPGAAAQLRAIGPGRWARAWLLPALHHTLTPVEPDSRPRAGQRIGPQVVLARYHLTRMPLRLLLPHAWHKLRVKGRDPAELPADIPVPRRVEETPTKGGRSPTRRP